MSGRENARCRQAEEDIGTADHVGQAARIGGLREFGLPPVHALVAALIDHAVDVGDPDVLAPDTERQKLVETGERGSACA